MRKKGKSSHRTPSTLLYGQAVEIESNRYRTFADCQNVLIHNPKEIRNIPSIYLGKRLFVAVAEINPQIISYIPAQYVDFDLCKSLVEVNRKSLRLISPVFKTEELYILHVQTHKRGLEDIPMEERSYTIYFEAVKTNKALIQQVPEEYKTFEMCCQSMNDGNGMNLIFTPLEQQNLALCIHAISNGCPASYVPSKIANTPAFKRELEALKREKKKRKARKDKKGKKRRSFPSRRNRNLSKM